MDPFAMFRPYVAREEDAGGGGGTPPAVSPDAAANARIDAAVAAGINDDTGETAPPAGTPAPAAPAPEAPAATDDDPLAGIDFEHLNYRDGKKLEAEIKAQRETFKPFRDAFGALPDADRQVAVESLQALGSDAGAIISLVGGMPANDRVALLNAYATFTQNPAEGAEAFKAIYEAAAQAAGVQPAAGSSPPPAPAVGAPADEALDPELDLPLTKREWQSMQAEQAAAAEIARTQEQQQTEMLSEVRALGYDPDSSDEGVKAQADEVIWLAAYRTAGDLKKADAILKERSQKIIDGYLDKKRADARRPGAPETGAAPSGETGRTKVDPMEAARARLDQELGPDRFARTP